MIFELHIAAFCEARLMPYILRHAASMKARVIIHDGGSTDATRELATYGGAEVRHWDTAGQINDALLTKLKQECWLGTDADWVGVVDADEFIYFPCGAEATLAALEEAQINLVKSHGYEMVSDKYPSTSGQIYDEVKHGGKDDRWYGKACLWSPKRVRSITFAAGAHECSGVLTNGKRFQNPTEQTVPPVYLLHCHHIEDVSAIGARYEEHKARMSEENKRNRWGNHAPGLGHAQNKRAMIMKTYQRIIP